MVGARNVGIRTVFARYGDTFDTVRSGADFEIDDIFAVVEIVDRLNGTPESTPAAPAVRGG
jgi:putative hydrolase of the HAD superfamily